MSLTDWLLSVLHFPLTRTPVFNIVGPQASGKTTITEYMIEYLRPYQHWLVQSSTQRDAPRNPVLVVGRGAEWSEFFRDQNDSAHEQNYMHVVWESLEPIPGPCLRLDTHEIFPWDGRLGSMIRIVARRDRYEHRSPRWLDTQLRSHERRGKMS